MRTIYREKKYKCGDYLEVYIYPVYKQPGRRTKKAKPSTATQAALNAKHAEQKLIRLLHNNFTSNDLELHLTYSKNPGDDEQAKRDVQNFIRRLRRLRRRISRPELKYIAVTEKSGAGRYHHHITINGGIDRDELESLWGKGYANSKRLQFGTAGLVGLARYIVKSPVFAKRWNASKNLIDPEPRTNDSRFSKRKAEELAQDTTDGALFERLYPSYLFTEAESFYNDFNGGVYLCARLYKADLLCKHKKRRSRL